MNIIGVPLYYGCDRQGVELGPDKLREKGLVQTLEQHGHSVEDLGNLSVLEATDETKYDAHPQMKYLNEIVDVSNQLAKSVFESLTANQFPLVIGGDHALSLGSVAGASQYQDDIAVIWVDAHADSNTIQTSPSGNIHGMPLGASMGAGEEQLTNIFFKGHKVIPANTYIIGASSIDPGEMDFLKEAEVNLYQREEIVAKGLTNILDEVVQKITDSGVKAIHLSWDVDSMEGDLVPGTGLPIKGGFTVEEVKTIFDRLFATNLVQSLDMVELNPLLDDEDMTADLVIDLVNHVGKLISQ